MAERRNQEVSYFMFPADKEMQCGIFAVIAYALKKREHYLQSPNHTTNVYYTLITHNYLLSIEFQNVQNIHSFFCA